MQFQDLKLTAPLLAAVKEAGYQTPSPIQQKTIPLVLEGRDVLGCAQTGTGKTAAFALPMLQRLNASRTPGQGKSRPVRALILTPTRELAIQIQENFEQYGSRLPLRTAVIFGGVSQNPQVEQLRRGVDILVATPGRLNDLVGQGFIHLDKLEIFVLDEADRMLDMGFIHDVRRVMALLPPKERRQTLLFSATMPPEVEELALQLLNRPATVKISPVTSTVDKIAQSVYFVAKEDKPAALLWLLEERHIETALVFTRTKHGADQVARKLNAAGVQAMAIHGNKSQNARQAALGQFKAGALRVLVATDIAARGIDVAELPFVINYNIPETPEAYIHRIGRTGRAGLEGQAVSLCCSDELQDWRDMEKKTGQSVPQAQCPWSVSDMRPTQAPPPGSGRAPKVSKSQASTPKASKSQAAPPKAPASQAPVPKASTSQTAPKTSASRAAAPRASTPKATASGMSYPSRLGASRPVRPFQSRSSSLARAEDFPPPPAAGVARDFDIHVLPEMSPLRAGNDWEEEPETQTAAQPSATAPRPRRRRRRRGGGKPADGSGGTNG